MDAVIAANRLTKRFRNFVALDDFNCRVWRGEVVGLLGPNGSGKSTLVRLLLGFLNPTSGSAAIMGDDCTRDRTWVHQNVAYLPGDARLFRTMRGIDVLNFFASIRGNFGSEQARSIAESLQLDLSRWVAFMSTGMRQKLALAAVLSVDVPVLILDEPTANLDPSVRQQVLELVIAARNSGRTILFCSHILSEIEAVCSRVLFLKDGRLVHEQRLAAETSSHMISASWSSQRPELPASLAAARATMKDQVISDPARLEIEVNSGEQLNEALSWLSDSDPANVEISRVDLKSIYNRFHGD